MLFSIIIPVYNRQDYLEECLESIIPQVKDCAYGAEVVLIDDGSTDRSGIICDEYKSKYGNLIHVIHNENQGLLLARCNGFQNAKGKYIINCDADDKLSDNMLEEIVNVINRNEPDVIFYNVDLFDGKRKTIYYKNVFTYKKKCEISHQDVMQYFFLSNIPVVTSMWGKVIKKACLNLEYGYKEFLHKSMGEDTLLSAGIYARAEKFAYLNENLYLYRIGTGMTSKYDEDFFFEMKEIELRIGQYEYVSDNSIYSDWLDAKIINTVGRAITQSRYNRNMNYEERKNYIKKIMYDDTASKCIKRLGELKKYLNKKYYWLIKLCCWHLYIVVHLMLKVKNTVK